MLPEMPRLLHQALQRQARPGESEAMLALLAEQRQTNRLLRGMLWVAIGFVLGLVLARVALFWLA
jgi:ubiquinone biosynthesis protein